MKTSFSVALNLFIKLKNLQFLKYTIDEAENAKL